MKTYTLENVNYGFNRNSRKWHFVVGKTQFILNCPGGKATADAVVKQIVANSHEAMNKGNHVVFKFEKRPLRFLLHAL